MKYSEYQVWFHAFNNAFNAIMQSSPDYTVNTTIDLSDKVADHCVKKFESVEQEAGVNMGGISGSDLSSLVMSTLKNSLGK